MGKEKQSYAKLKKKKIMKKITEKSKDFAFII